MVLIDALGSLVMGAVKHLQGPKTYDHGGEGCEDNQANDREPEAETSGLAPPEFLALLVLDALERARTDDPPVRPASSSAGK